MLAIIPLVPGALVLTTFNNVFPLLSQIITTSWVLTNNVDFSSWSCHSIYQECIRQATIINYRMLGHYLKLANPADDDARNRGILSAFNNRRNREHKEV